MLGSPSGPAICPPKRSVIYTKSSCLNLSGSIFFILAQIAVPVANLIGAPILF